jgi:glutamate synthase domain-containing protein 2
MGVPLSEGLVFVHNALMGIGVRDKIRIIAAGKVATGFDMITKIAMGADMCNAARAMMMSIGCIQSLQCHANTCPTGVATQDPRLAKGLVVDEKKVRAMHFHHATVHSFLELAGAMGLGNPSDIQPRHVMRRINGNEVKSFQEIYEFIPSGSLLGNDIPESFRIHWQHASAESFESKQ